MAKKEAAKPKSLDEVKRDALRQIELKRREAIDKIKAPR